MSKNFEIEPLFEETLDFTELSSLTGGAGGASGNTGCSGFLCGSCSGTISIVIK